LVLQVIHHLKNKPTIHVRQAIPYEFAEIQVCLFHYGRFLFCSINQLVDEHLEEVLKYSQVFLWESTFPGAHLILNITRQIPSL